MCYNKTNVREKVKDRGEPAEPGGCDIRVFRGGRDPPLRLQFQDDKQQLFRVNINEVVSKTEIQYVGVEAVVFLCRAWVADREWLFELKYSIRSHVWSLMRKVY